MLPPVPYGFPFGLPYGFVRPFLFGLDPQRAHELTLDAIARLQGDEALDVLLAALRTRRDEPARALGRRVPMFNVKAGARVLIEAAPPAKAR